MISFLSYLHMCLFISIWVLGLENNLKLRKILTFLRVVNLQEIKGALAFQCYFNAAIEVQDLETDLVYLCRLVFLECDSGPKSELWGPFTLPPHAHKHTKIYMFGCQDAHQFHSLFNDAVELAEIWNWKSYLISSLSLGSYFCNPSCLHPIVLKFCSWYQWSLLLMVIEVLVVPLLTSDFLLDSINLCIVIRDC